MWTLLFLFFGLLVSAVPPPPSAEHTYQVEACLLPSRPWSSLYAQVGTLLGFGSEMACALSKEWEETHYKRLCPLDSWLAASEQIRARLGYNPGGDADVLMFDSGDCVRCVLPAYADTETSEATDRLRRVALEREDVCAFKAYGMALIGAAFVLVFILSFCSGEEEIQEKQEGDQLREVKVHQGATYKRLKPVFN